mgnify:CR=1 FL=1
MRKYKLQLEGWVTDTIFVTAADKPEAVKLATQEFINRKGCENAMASTIEEIEND